MFRVEEISRSSYLNPANLEEYQEHLEDFAHTDEWLEFIRTTLTTLQGEGVLTYCLNSFTYRVDFGENKPVGRLSFQQSKLLDRGGLHLYILDNGSQLNILI